MSGINWLASYPKSGNTWIRVFLENYWSGPGAAPASLNRLSIPNAAHRSLFDRFGVIESSEFTDEELQELRPALYRSLGAELWPPVLKVHDAFGRTPQGALLFPPDVTHAIVYVIRHPADVAVSLGFHLGVPLDRAVRTLSDSKWTMGGDARQCRQRIGSWSAHILAWLDVDIPTRIVRYEDMVADPESAFAGIVETLGLPFEPSRLEHALHLSAFERLKAAEAGEGFIERPAQSSAPFFRSGRAGAWRDHLDATTARRIVDEHGEMMRRFGYLDHRGEIS